MKNYTHIKIESTPLLTLRTNQALKEWNNVHQDVLYDDNTLRERLSIALSRTRSYSLRVPDVPHGSVVKTSSTKDVIECRRTKFAPLFPEVLSFVDFMGDLLYGGWTTLGRIFVTKLAPNSSIGAHIDEGAYFDTLHRHHLVLDSQGSTFHWEKDSITMMTGESWIVNNSIMHWVTNLSDMPRTHLIWDGK